jgi:CRISPR-associated protein Csm4
MQVFLPIRRYHVGSGTSIEESRVIVGADTLFGAICWAFSFLYGDDECKVLVNRFRSGDPPFLTSSAFPARKTGDRIVYLLPFPTVGYLRERIEEELKKRQPTDEQRFYRKSVAGVELVSMAGLLSIINGDYSVLKVVDLGRPAVVREDEDSELPLFKVLKSYRNVLDRRLYASDVFRFSYVELCEGCGLSFWVRFFDSSLESVVRSAVRLVNEMGLGGEKSLGLGIGEGDAEFLPNSDVSFGVGDALMTISPYVPTDAEVGRFLHGGFMAYNLIERTAFYQSGRFRYFCFSEGSIFPKLNDMMVYGRMVDIERNISRYGYGFMVEVSLSGFEGSGQT